MYIPSKSRKVELKSNPVQVDQLYKSVQFVPVWIDVTKERTKKKKRKGGREKRDKEVEVVEMPTLATKGLQGSLEDYRGLWFLHEIMVEKEIERKGGHEKGGEGGREIAGGSPTSH